MKKYKAFSLAELLTVILIIGVITAASAPLMTIKQRMKDYEFNSVVCVKQDLGATTTACATAEDYAKNNQMNAITALVHFANHGSSAAEQTAAKKILRQACDAGGKDACNYFITSCMKDSALCDIASSDYDLHYYLALAKNNNNIGRLKARDIAKPFYKRGNTNIVDIVDNTCCNPGVNTACSVNDTPFCPKAWCWGDNRYGKFGNNSTVDSFTPTKAGNDQPFVSISAGQLHTCGVDLTNKGWCWGYGNSGRLGDGGFSTKHLPSEVENNHSFAAITAGEHHSCGIDTDGKAWCWGWSMQGELGNSSVTSISTPINVTGTNIFSSISAGYAHTCAIDTAGDAWCWGWNITGQLGDRTNISKNSPVEVLDISSNSPPAFTSISAGYFHTCAIDINNKAWCWGNNPWGQLGDGSSSGKNYAIEVAGGHSFSSITAGAAHTCAIDTSGKAWCWGGNLSRQLGDNYTAIPSSWTPVGVVNNHIFTAISTGPLGSHTCGITTNEETWCWGKNTDGQLGDNSTIDRGYPVKVQNNHVFTTIDIGTNHSCGIEIEY